MVAVSKYNLFTLVLSFLTPQTITFSDSSLNGRIRVEKYFGRNRIVVGGFWQSGEYSKKVIKRALTDLPKKKNEVKNILLLGVGGGSAVEVINDLFPDANITGVDIDPCMIEIGKKYFHLNKAKNLKMVISDAFNFVKKNRNKQRYDIILVDLYVGCDYPPFVGENEYFTCVRKLLTPRGVYIFNGSYILENRAKTDELVRKIKTQFPHVELIHKKPNLIIGAYKKGKFNYY